MDCLKQVPRFPVCRLNNFVHSLLSCLVTSVYSILAVLAVAAPIMLGREHHSP